MKRYKSLNLLISAFVLTFFLPLNLSAETLSVKKCINSTGSWCWAGAMECVVKYYDKSAATQAKSQAQIVSGVTTNQNDAPATSKILAGLKQSLSGLKIEVTESTAKPTEAEFKAEADKKELIYVLMTWTGSGGYHAMVYVGYIGSNHYIMDPWESPSPYAKRTYATLLKTSELEWQRCFKFKSPSTTLLNDLGNNSSLAGNNFKILLNSELSPGSFAIRFNSATLNEKTMQLFTPTGRIAYETTIGAQTLQKEFNLPANNFPSGIYTIAISDKGNPTSVNNGNYSQILRVVK